MMLLGGPDPDHGPWVADPCSMRTDFKQHEYFGQDSLSDHGKQILMLKQFSIVIAQTYAVNENSKFFWEFSL